MKKSVLLMLCAFFALSIFAQQHEGGKRSKFSPERYKRNLEEFVVKKVCLTEAEAKVFFPVYHEMKDKQRALGREINKLMKEGRNAQNESDYKRIVEKTVELELEQKKIESTYNKKFHTILSWEKIFKVKRALREFNMEALKRFYPSRNHGPEHRPNHQR